MKKLILLSLCLFACALTLSAQQTIYVIDNETVEHFDGSQLKGKKIKDYKITTTGSGRKAITVHSITTSRSAFTAHFYNPHLDSLKTPEFSEFKTFQADTLISLKDVRVISTTPRKVVYVIDGVRHDDAKAFNSLSPMDIENITVIKDDSPEAKAYGENVSVIKIQTKKGGNGLMESLKNLPGVKVEADGSITANGQPIKKITINGSSYSIGAEE